MSKARGLADLGNAYSDGALSNRNLIINGAMQVAQRGTSFSTSAPQYTLDRMRRAESSLDNAVIDVEQSTDAPDGFAYSLKATTSTVEGTVNAGDAYYPLLYRIEAQDLQRLQYATTNAKTLTASFWVKSSVTGTYVLSLYNNDNARLIGKAYSINTANTWEYKVLTFAGDTTDGFNNDTGIGLELYFAAGGGSQFTSGTLPSAWEDYSNANFLAGQSVNLQNTLNATWQITGVQLELGDTATPFEHRSYGDELARCQRYFYQWVDGAGQSMGIGGYYASTLFVVQANHPVPMRATPTASITSGTDYYRIWRNGTYDDCSLSTGYHNNNSTIYHSIFDMTGDISGTAGHSGRILSLVSSANIYLDAEL